MKLLQTIGIYLPKELPQLLEYYKLNFAVEPSRLIAAGRSSYVPLAPNDTPANKSKNRRTKIIILPKIGQFFEMLETKAE